MQREGVCETYEIEYKQLEESRRPFDNNISGVGPFSWFEYVHNMHTAQHYASQPYERWDLDLDGQASCKEDGPLDS